ncbi:MAG: methyltransferase domain-containing protein, partial [Bacteroidetes bacterium]|nr:methyltransferase domain-containing protein [Bacteroidota bacterium]
MHLERTKAVARDMLEQIPVTSTMKALEFGAGTGLLSFFVKDLFAEITLMDTSEVMLQKAEEKLTAGDHGKIKTLFFDLEKNRYSGERFDLIFTQMVLHHIKDVNLILGKFFDLLNPGGYIAIADLYSEDGTFHDPGVEVHPGFDPEELSNQLKNSGFSNLSASPCFTIHKETSTGAFREYPIFLITAKK